MAARLLVLPFYIAGIMIAAFAVYMLFSYGKVKTILQKMPAQKRSQGTWTVRLQAALERPLNKQQRSLVEMEIAKARVFEPMGMLGVFVLVVWGVVYLLIR